MIKRPFGLQRNGTLKRSKSSRPRIEWMEPRTLLSAVTWTGTAGDNNWDTAANWSTDTIPGAADDVTINIAADVVHSDDVSDSINSLTSTEPLTISGGSLSIAAASTTSAALTIDGGTLTGTGAITVGGLLTLTSGTLSDSGTVTANGGIAINPAGGSFALDGTTLTNAAGQTATWSGAASGIAGSNGAVFNNLGTFLAQNDGTFTGSSGGASFNNQGSFTKSGDVGEVDFGPQAAFNVSGGGAVDVQSGTLGLLAGGTDTGAGFTVASGTTLDFGGSTPFSLDSGTTFSGAGSLTKDSSTTLLLPGNSPSFTGTTTVSAGTLLVDGSQPASAVSVLSGSTLGGSGTVGAITTTGSTISPGDSPGILNAQGNVTLDGTSTFTAELNGAAPGAGGYDQLNVTGAVNLGGSALVGSLGFTPTTGEAFTIVASTAPIVGTFAGLAEGASVTIGADSFRISYASNDVTLTQLQAPAITSPAATAFAIGLANTFTVTTTGFPASALSETGALPSGVTFVDNGDGTATLAGTPAASGSFPFTITAANGITPDATQNFTLTVAAAAAPAITSAAATTFTTGTAGTFTVTTTGVPTPALTETGALPTGVTFVDDGDGTATLAGTPAAGTGGTYALTITAANGQAPDATQSFTLTVDQAPAITSANSTTFTTGTLGTFTVTTTGFPIPTPLTETGALPSGVTFVDNLDGTATLAGTVAAGTGGTYSLTITAANTVLPDATQTFTLTVDQAPAITSAATTSFAVGIANTFTVTTTGFPTSALTETGALPTGVTFVDNANGTATLAGTPAVGSDGTYALTITAANGVLPDATQSFTLTIAAAAAPAITSAATTTFTTGTAGTFTVTTTGVPTSALSETGALPTGVTFVDDGDGTATLAGTPAAGSGGTYALTITAANGQVPDATQSFTLTVDQAPAITSANSTTFTAGTAGTFTVTTTGFPTSALTETGTLPTGVTFTDNGDGTATLAGTPAAGTGGTYALTITAANGVLPDATQSFTLTVDQAPAITSADSTTFTTGTAGTFTVTTTGFPTSALSETGALPTGVTFVDNADGTATLAGTPAAGTGGTYALTITAANTVLPDATQSFTLTVDQAPAITSAATQSFAVGKANTFTVTTSGFPTSALSETRALPTRVTFVDNGDGSATLAGTPAAGSVGTYPLTITAANTVLPDATQSFTLTVAAAAAPAITSAATTTFTTGTLGTFTVTTTGVPTPALTETGALPTGVTFVDDGDGTATLAGTPAAGTGGTYALTITATNGQVPDAIQSFTLTVDQAPAITSAVARSFAVDIANTFTVTTTGFPIAGLTETGTLPAGVTFVDNTDGTATLAGTPAAGTGGTYAFTIDAANGVAPDATQNFTLTVAPAAAPAITSAATTTFTMGMLGTFDVTTTGVPTPALTESGALPSGVTFVDNGDGTATLAGTPAPGTGGTYVLTITAANGQYPDAAQSFTLTVNQAPAITSADSTTFTTGMSGTFAVTTTGFPISALSETGALPGGVTFLDNGDGTATLAGTPDAGTGGTYALTIIAANGVLPDATQSFTLTVDQAPAITSAAATSFAVSLANTFTVTTTGFPTSALSETGALPSGVTFVDNGNGTATLAGTPAVGTDGTYPLTITAANGVTPDATQSFTLTVDQAPAITSADATTFNTGTAGTFTVTTTGFPTSALSETGALPTGVTFVDNGDGTATLAGTPAAGSGGTYALTITATNGVTPDATQSFTLTVDQAPAITSADATTFTAGTAGTFTVTTSGVPNPALSETGALPTGVTFVDDGDGTATLAGTPAAGTGGTYALTITATNGVTPDATQSFTLTVDQAPAITSADAQSFAIGQANTFTVTTSGFPISALSETGALPTGVTFVDNGDGTATLTGTPAAGTGGTYALTITAANMLLPDATQSFTLTVDQAPAITSANSTTFTTSALGTFTVTTTGFPIPTPLTETGALPSGVTFVDNLDGTATLAGTPAAGTGGTYALTITATNGVSPDATQSFTLTVDQAPAITSADAQSFAIGQANTFTVTTSGFPTSALSETGALPTGVTFVDNLDGTATLAGTPAVGTDGTYPLTITAANGVLPDATQSFTLTVAAAQAPAITSAATATFTTGTAGSFTVTTTGAPSPGLTETGTLPTGVTFVSNGDGTATLAGTPAAGTGGTYALTIDAANGVTPNATQTFTLTVDQAPAITSADATAFAIGTAGSFTVTTTGFPTSALTEAGALPTGVTFLDNGNGTATLAGTPAAGSNPTYTLTITAANGITPDATQTFTLNVAAAPVAPAITSAAAATFTTGAADSFTVTTTGAPSPVLTETGGLPTGVTFVSNGDGTATLAGTPAAGTGGTYALTITAANGVTPDATQTFTLTVDQAPAITSADSTTFAVGAASTFTVTTTGFPTSALTETGALPSGVTFVDNGNGTATIAGTPAAGTGGTYALTITAANGVLPDATQSFTLTVDQAPAITSADSTTFTTSTLGTFTVTTTGFPIAALSETGALPTGVTFVDDGNGTATLAGTPAAGTAGTYALTITAANSVLPAAIQSFTLTVNQAPAITSANSTTFTTGTFGTFTVTTSGFPTPALSETGALPSGVTFVDNGDGTATLAGTPAVGTTGTYAVTITADNGVDPTQSFTLNVTAAVAAPTVTGISPTSGPAAGGTSVTITGTGFTGATVVDFGTTAATGVAVVNDTTITAVSPAGTGVVDVTVTTPGGTSAISPADQFTYVVAPPTVVSLVRFGFHAQPTSLVLTFSSALNATQAQNVNNYQIVILGRAEEESGRALVHIRAAVYDPDTFTVTLDTARRLDLHKLYRLTVSELRLVCRGGLGEDLWRVPLLGLRQRSGTRRPLAIR